MAEQETTAEGERAEAAQAEASSAARDGDGFALRKRRWFKYLPGTRAFWLHTFVSLHDVTMAGLAVLLAFALRFDWSLAALARLRGDILIALAIAMPVSMLVYRFHRLHRGIWRFASVRDLLIISLCAAWVAVALGLVGFFGSQWVLIPRSIPFLVLVLLPAMLGGPRMFYRVLRDGRLIAAPFMSGSSRAVPVLLMGAGNDVQAFIRANQTGAESSYFVVGILTDEPSYQGGELLGVPVLGTVSDLSAAVRKLERRERKPRRLVLSNAVLKHDVDQIDSEVFAIAQELGISVARLSRVDRLTSATEGEGPSLAPISLEDILGREPRRFDISPLAQRLGGQVALVTGAGGSIGSELCRQICALGVRELVLLEASEFNLYAIEIELRQAFPDLAIRPLLANIRDRDRIARILAETKPRAVFHAAALKHVPLVELNPCEAVLTNVIGTRNVVEAAAANGVESFVLVSTDKAVNPSSLMGASKRLAEKVVQRAAIEHAGTRFMAVRFGNVLGSSGSVVPLFRQQLENGGPITVTHPEMTRFFMTIPEAVALILQAYAIGNAAQEGQPEGLQEGQATARQETASQETASQETKIQDPEVLDTRGTTGVSNGAPGSGTVEVDSSRRSKIFVLDMGQPVKILDLAKQMIRLAGFRPGTDIEIKYTGVRPGEKLYEELFYDSESLDATPVKGLMISRGDGRRALSGPEVLDRLQALAESGDTPSMRALIQEAVPSYAQSPDL